MFPVVIENNWLIEKSGLARAEIEYSCHTRFQCTSRNYSIVKRSFVHRLRTMNLTKSSPINSRSNLLACLVKSSDFTIVHSLNKSYQDFESFNYVKPQISCLVCSCKIVFIFICLFYTINIYHFCTDDWNYLDIKDQIGECEYN